MDSVGWYTQGALVACSALVFALALLVVAFVLLHLVRAIATIDQFKEQQRDRHDARTEAAFRAQRQYAPEQANLEDDDLRQAILDARRAQNGSGAHAGEGEQVTTMAENENLDDDRPPIPGDGYYR